MKSIPRSVIFLGLVSFFNDIAAEMIYPIVPIFLTSILGTPVSIMGTIEGVAEATAALMKFVSGYISDKVKKRKIFVVAGYSFSSLSKLLIGLSFSWHFVLFARFIDRLGKGVRTSARDSILLSYTTRQNKGFIFGFHRAADSAGAVLGPIVALLLLSLLKENLRLIFFLAFIPSVIGVLLLIVFVREKREENLKLKAQNSEYLNFKTDDTRRWLENLGAKPKIPILETELPKKTSARNLNPSFKLFFAISLLFSLGNSSDAFLILRSQNLGLSISLVIVTYMLYNLSQTIFAIPAGKLADKIGARKVYALGLLVFAFVYFLFGAISNPFWLWLIFPVYGLYIAATDGVSKAYISKFIKEEESGTYFGLYQTGMALSYFFASFIAGILWIRVGPSATFFYGCFMALLAFAVLAYGKIVRRI